MARRFSRGACERCLALVAGAVLGALLWIAPAAAQAMRPVEDPAAHSQGLLKTLETEGSDSFTEELVKFLRNASGTEKIANNLRHFSKKQPDVSGVVQDRNYNNLVRTILYFSSYDDNRYPFLYYVFTYKMTKAGWALTNFRFESELSRAFPEEFLTP